MSYMLVMCIETKNIDFTEKKPAGERQCSQKAEILQKMGTSWEERTTTTTAAATAITTTTTCLEMSRCSDV